LKNPTSGDIAIGVNNVLAAQKPHVFPLDGYQVTSSGNPYAHLVLRGGTSGTNYGAQSIDLATKLMQEKKIQNPSIIVDASHANSQGMNGDKDPCQQDEVLAYVTTGMQCNPGRYQFVRGFMLESHLKEGKQSDKGPDFQPGLSITDACRGWEGTERVIRRLAEMNAGRKTT
jgi:3-deoxy-7-phosphoheptulonate synthase